MNRKPYAENDRFAIWRPRGEGAEDVVLHKETGRWAIGRAVGMRLSATDSDEDRQSAIMEMVRDLDLELTDGSPAVAPVGPSFGM